MFLRLDYILYTSITFIPKKRSHVDYNNARLLYLGHILVVMWLRWQNYKHLKYELQTTS